MTVDVQAASPGDSTASRWFDHRLAQVWAPDLGGGTGVVVAARPKGPHHPDRRRVPMLCTDEVSARPLADSN